MRYVHSTYLSAALAIAGLGVASASCSDTAGAKGPDAGAPDAGNQAFASGTELRIAVPDTGRVFVALDPPSVVTVTGDPRASRDWDLAFERFGIYTNSEASGSGKGASFGPLEPGLYAGAVPQGLPLEPDKTGGAFVGWYTYDGNEHLLYSPYHVFAVKDGARAWKVQVLSYYGPRDGTSVAALYQVRYAELFADHVGPTIDLKNLDGTAGGSGVDPTVPGECVDLGSGARTMLVPDATRASSAWHLCFRRAAVSVNGELGGPRGTVAIDLDAAQNETLEQVKGRTAESEKPRFDAVTMASLDGKTLRGDRIVNPFSEAWADTSASPVKPVFASWVATSATGTKRFFLGFSAFENPTAASPGTVVAHIRPVNE